MPLPSSKRLSCGVLLISPQRELLLCHVTGQSHWDLPKGGLDAGETPLQAALRETVEECGLRLDATRLLDLGRFAYTAHKDLHLFAAGHAHVSPRQLHCESRYFDRASGRHRPEMDDFGWFAFDRVAERCTAPMAKVLGERLDLARLGSTLHGDDTAACAEPIRSRLPLGLAAVA